ncbi:N-acetylglucosaminidase [Staphylococcus massiliensis]|uniref:N-acetylglucosaminidase n=1 Tax=Staphylococcus massiliensis TaxID=555791 RepID=UPI001EDEB79B|nr:N-acetylglucosaminidase [Staphylococcus massiliensis]MCG3399689.1 N-acetylglucosaminidase [Staphylococcus massiliensis]MCG3400794.1 N-acetylglucosaminidase [Staphylococcus massiliensis]MCG3412042.1 N-acetylglucosaminidase [Staphylococcus massiliensis]
MKQEKSGSKLAIVGLLLAVLIAGIIFFMMIADQIFFEDVEEVVKVEQLDTTLDKAAKKQINNHTSQQTSDDKNKTWRDADSEEIKEMLDTERIADDKEQKYQFLNLSKYQGIKENRIKRMLRDREMLRNHTDDFVKASKKYNINEVYLISHAILETGDNKSELSKGIEIDGKKYYNFFGVGARDEAPIKTGSEYAKKKGWDTPEKAIEGGAEFIHKHFLSRTGQNTLYSMRWNPKNPGEHQYATDIKWAESNASLISEFYEDINTEGKYFTVFHYKSGDGDGEKEKASIKDN